MGVVTLPINHTFFHSLCDAYPFTEIQSSEDGWSNYGCVNVRDCLDQLYPDGQDHRITRVWFNGAIDFWVDEFVVANSLVSCKSLYLTHTHKL